MKEPQYQLRMGGLPSDLLLTHLEPIGSTLRDRSFIHFGRQTGHCFLRY